MGAAKLAMVESAREVCGSVRIGGKNPRSVWLNGEIKAEVRRKNSAWKRVLAASDEETKERCMEACREEKINVNRCIIRRKEKVNEQSGRKINEDANGNRKLFWKKVSNTKGGKVECCSRIKGENERLAHMEDEVIKIRKKILPGNYYIWRGNCFGGESIGRPEVEERVQE